MKNEQSPSTENSTGDKTSPPQATTVPRWKQRAREIAWPVHARFPNIIPNPYGTKKSDWRERDAEDNIESALDGDVTLKLSCIMVSEIFGPNEIETLYDGLEKIGWDRERFPVRDISNIDWLKEQRLYGTEARMPLGWIHRPDGTKKYIGVRYTAVFPKEFSSLLVTITQLTPSVTCLSVGFILTDETSLEYANEINRSAQTIYAPKRGTRTYSIKNVSHVKEERVQRIRQKYRNLGISWLSKNFPGFFSEHCERSHFPTVEFLSLDGFTPFERDVQKNREWMHWSRFVNIDSDFGSWTCTSAKSLKFSFNAKQGDKLPNHMTVALRWDTLSDDNTKRHSGESLGSRTYFANERLGGIISRFAIASYVSELLRILKETRQSLSARSKTRNSSNGVEQISAFFLRSVGVPSIAREVLTLSKNDASFQWDATGFIQKRRHDSDEVYEIKDVLKSFLRRISRQLLEEDKDTREFLNQLSAATGTKESVAAQRRMEFIGWSALIVAVFSMIVAAFATFGNY